MFEEFDAKLTSTSMVLPAWMSGADTDTEDIANFHFIKELVPSVKHIAEMTSYSIHGIIGVHSIPVTPPDMFFLWLTGLLVSEDRDFKPAPASCGERGVVTMVGGVCLELELHRAITEGAVDWGRSEPHLRDGLGAGCFYQARGGRFSEGFDDRHGAISVNGGY